MTLKIVIMKSKSLNVICWIIFTAGIGSFMSCKKYLDVKSDSRLSTPGTLEDLRAILNNDLLMLGTGANNTSSDEYYTPYENWVNKDVDKGCYVWDPRANEKTQGNDWKNAYAQILVTNIALDNLEKIPPGKQQQEWNAIKGRALFLRAINFFMLAQIYVDQFDQATAASKPGIALRLTSDFNAATKRASMQETYDQIIGDLNTAITLLPDIESISARPSKATTHALLARIYLQMENYSEALKHANACLLLYDSLLDFNNMPDIPIPFIPFNKEVLLQFMASFTLSNDPLSAVDSVLYNSYSPDDLRKTLYYEPITDYTGMHFDGTYTGNLYLFNGLATDEVFLIKAECLARMNKVNEAMESLNTLLVTRWKWGTFTNLTAANAEEALRIILQERKKELVNRGTRWGDLRRLNKDPRFAITLKRVMNGQVYTLPPNDLRYTLLIPDEVIKLTGIPQNPR